MRCCSGASWGDNVAVWENHTFTLTTTQIFIEIQTKPRNMNTSSGGVDDDSRPAVSDRRSTKRMREVLRSEFNGARDLSELRFLLTRGASVNVPFKDKSWETTYAILEVVRQKYWDDDWVFQKIRLLCRFGADVNVSNANCITPLYLVMYRNWCNTPKQHVLEIKVGRLLLHYGATRAPTSACILCRTVRLKTVEHIRILLDAGVDVDEIERETGQNALVIAKNLRRWDAVCLLQMRSARRGRKMVLPS